jgi:translation initiation factor 3 subunit E
MIDYTTDIRQRLNLSEKMPEELIQKRANVLTKLKELQQEVEPLMKCMEDIKTRDTMKDSKTLINVLQTEYNVSIFRGS